MAPVVHIYCHLCGVSFNIARSRRVDEPFTAAWDYTGNHLGADDEILWEDCAEKGCSYAVLPGNNEQDDDLVNDPDYLPREETMHEPYEYVSDYESTDDKMLEEPEEDTTEENDEDNIENQWYSDWLSSFPPPEEASGEPIWTLDTAPKNHIILPVPENGEVPESSVWEPVEHIAGPDCSEVNAYSGRKISLEEMRGCRTAQCLIHKGSCGRWQPDGLEQDWERSGDFFLSGLCDGMPSRDMGGPTVFPPRGGIDGPRVENIVWDNYEDPTVYSIPFHPWCFDIYSRQAKCHFNHLNLNGLMKWRNTESTFEDFHEFPRWGEVMCAQEQFWSHNAGCEFLVANPLYIPKLPSILLAAVKDNNDFSPQNGAFDLHQTTERDAMLLDLMQCSTDPLLALPREIRLMIVKSLGSRDIANLRLASRAFQQLPVSVWYRLIREEMPWLWEAWDESECVHTPSLWTAVTADEVEMIYKIREHQIKVVTEEYQTGELDPNVIDDMVRWPPAVPHQIKLPRAKTNWYEVYTEIKRNWGELKGLKNRMRIWEDVEEIIGRIKKYQT
ncbi:uncharacterized protein BDW43DRAFT_303142 [Aspergillus alliaceus]|uniref:uncharacterized protein n=1 Tax=Petromyces alliaceus TaxID=209559 RepID=UPI0012A63D83|nr:uncharacterized protein BDW43DRAFT_303142 [Aspergillus alliaceus]KAB8229395.1 hypothetical protein BDW43DRAFT_303142 [Aspergillus alliaceus]